MDNRERPSRGLFLSIAAIALLFLTLMVIGIVEQNDRVRENSLAPAPRPDAVHRRAPTPPIGRDARIAMSDAAKSGVA